MSDGVERPRVIVMLVKEIVLGLEGATDQLW